MEFRNVGQIEKATQKSRQEMFRLGVALIFIVIIMMITSIRAQGLESGYLLVIAAMIGGYMAMNIGANDVANNVGPAVGSKAMTMTGAILIAAVFEAAGALIAGGEVVSTIKSGIIDPSLVTDPAEFVWLMMAALLAGALWLNLATYVGAPVSTTHSIVGGVLGAGIAAGGMAIANWGSLAAIAASWVVSPLLGAFFAAALLYFIKRKVTYRPDMLAAAERFVPLLLALMAWSFITYLVLKGLKALWVVDFWEAALIGLAGAVVVLLITRPWIRRRSKHLENNRDGVSSLFTIPLVASAALLSFAHGANDVANAVGPLAAINDALVNMEISGKAPIPLWIMLVGAVGISLGLALYGPKLIKTVGQEITDLDKLRAFCIALSAAFTVIVASQFGLPVSSTHIAVGAVFGVGLLREYLKTSYASQLHLIVEQYEGPEREKIRRFLETFKKSSLEDMDRMLKLAKKNKMEIPLKKKERKRLKRVYKEELVKRSALSKIVAAWIITVPASALLGAIIFFTIKGMVTG